MDPLPHVQKTESSTSRFHDRSKGYGIDGAARVTTHLIGLVAYRLSCDYFGWTIAPLFGIYGLEVKGVPFSNLYWGSMMLLLPISLVYARFVSRRMDLFDIGIALLFIASYVPLTSAWWIAEGPSEYVIFASAFWLLTLMATSGFRRREAMDARRIGFAEEGIGFAYAVLLLFLGGAILLRFGIPTHFDFESVYSRREAFHDWIPRGPAAYIFSWSVYVFCVYLLFVANSIVYKTIAAGFILLIFSASGDKIYALIIPVLIFAYVLAQRKLWMSVLPLAATGILVSAWLFHVGELWVPSLVQRLLFLPADIAFHYVERFPEKLIYGYSFLSSIFDYRESNLPSFIVGKEFYSGNDNATANFLVDAFVNIGWIAIPLLVGFFLLLRLILSPGPHLIVLVPLFLQLLDTALPTTLLTGGGALMVATAYMIARKKGEAYPEVPGSGRPSRPAIRH